MKRDEKKPNARYRHEGIRLMDIARSNNQKGYKGFASAYESL